MCRRALGAESERTGTALVGGNFRWEGTSGGREIQEICTRPGLSQAAVLAIQGFKAFSIEPFGHLPTQDLP